MVPISVMVTITIRKEEWTGRKPSMSHLRSFGCDAYVHIPKEKRSKLDMKSQKCILVGYGDIANVCRLYNPSSKL
jgi:hypothetical protein